MALTTSYLVTTKNLEAFLNAIRSAKAPERFTNKFLSQLDFSSSNDRLFVGMLKSLGMLDQNGVPTQRYYDFLDQSQSGRILAEGLREAYEDLFAVNKDAYLLTADEVKNKLRTLTLGQKSDNVLGLMANTFKALADLADWEAPPKALAEAPIAMDTPKAQPTSNREPVVPLQRPPGTHAGSPELHYNIQIHLPESRDPAVFDAIFQALKAHLF